MAFEIVEIENHDKFQDIKIPEKFKINDDKAYIKKVGDVIYLIPYHSAWDSLINSKNKVTDDFMDQRDDSAIQERETLD